MQRKLDIELILLYFGTKNVMDFESCSTKARDMWGIVGYEGVMTDTIRSL